MNTEALAELCSTLEAQAAIFEICGETIDVDLHLKTSAGLREALAEIQRLRSDAAALPEVLAEMQRLRSDADLHLKTSDALRDALAEIERLRSDADLHLKTSDALRDALAEIERLRSDADLYLKTSDDALRDALAEIERLRSDADALPLANAEIGRPRPEADAELHRGKLDRGMSNPATTFWAIDWFLKLLDPSNPKNKPK